HRAQIAQADFVQLERLAGDVIEVVDVELVFEARDRCRGGLAAAFDAIGTARQHRLLVEPHDTRGDLIGDGRRLLLRGDDVAAADIDLLREGQGYGLTAARHIEVAVGGDDAGNMAAPAGGLDDNAVAGPDLPARYG